MVRQGNKFYNKGHQRQTSWQVWALTWFFLSEEIHQWKKEDVIVDDNGRKTKQAGVRRLRCELLGLTSMCLSA